MPDAILMMTRIRAGTIYVRWILQISSQWLTIIRIDLSELIKSGALQDIFSVTPNFFHQRKSSVAQVRVDSFNQIGTCQSIHSFDVRGRIPGCCNGTGKGSDWHPGLRLDSDNGGG